MTIIDPDELTEVVDALEHGRALLEQLVIRGVRTAGPAEHEHLDALADQLHRQGASHLAGRMRALLEAMREDDPGAAVALLRAQASLHVFDRVLTMRVVDQQLGAAIEAELGEVEPA